MTKKEEVAQARNRNVPLHMPIFGPSSSFVFSRTQNCTGAKEGKKFKREKRKKKGRAPPQ